jgi:hypothetical protein
LARGNGREHRIDIRCGGDIRSNGESLLVAGVDRLRDSFSPIL